MTSPLGLRLYKALACCPACSRPVRCFRSRADFIPRNCAVEAIFICGAAVYVTRRDEYEVARACPEALELALDALQERARTEAADA